MALTVGDVRKNLFVSIALWGGFFAILILGVLKGELMFCLSLGLAFYFSFLRLVFPIGFTSIVKCLLESRRRRVGERSMSKFFFVEGICVMGVEFGVYGKSQPHRPGMS